MKGIFDLLEKIRVRPGMYIGHISAHDLFIFLEGYQTARQELGIELTQAEIEFYDEFQPWLQERYNISISASWAKIIEFYTGSDERAFHRFFELLDEFWGRHEQIGTDLVEQEIEVVKAN
ncbi:MAG: hypothetical protein KME21_04075 [Desmonostoc vinosum HA7617-LM4]|jgi:hypothetical protein|nr:hypothetical protein [Desmonostoc vinosum HA7617-LM4]